MSLLAIPNFYRSLLSARILMHNIHEEFGEAVVLVTQSKMSKEMLEQILKDLPKNKRPKFQLNVQEYPQVSNGKIDRKSIRSLVKESQHLLSRL